MKTIVEYSAEKSSENAYPKRIVSPPQAGPCCLSYMERVGVVHRDGVWRFFYRRCTICGFTVRRFESFTAFLLPGNGLFKGRSPSAIKTVSGKRGRGEQKTDPNPPQGKGVRMKGGLAWNR